MATSFKEVPVAACKMTVASVEFGENGEGKKSAPISMLVRGSEPIQHWYWGKVVHDFSAMRLKNRIPIDYVHDDKEVIGYLNHNEITADGLKMSGALVPYKDNDRASEIIHKQREGVPYEASINFAGDFTIEEVGEGESQTVNGLEFSGPGVIIKDWPLRGVAVCPYGADSNTESVINFSSSDKLKIQITKKGKSEMPETKANEIAQENSPVEHAATEGKPVDVAQEKLSEKAEGAQPVEAKKEAVEASEFPVSEFKKINDEFGAEIASKVMLSGGGYAEAQKLAFEKVKAENDELKKQLSASVGTDPVTFNPPSKKVPFESLFKSKK